MGKCTFQSTWLLRKDHDGHKVSEWASRKDDDSIFCDLCDSVVKITKGFQAIFDHSKTNKHKEMYALKLNPMQLRMVNEQSNPSPCSSNQTDGSNHENGLLQLYSIKDAATTAELIWTLKTVSSNYSFLSSVGLNDVFQAMFPNGIPQGFTLNPKKLKYLICDAIAPYFREKIIEDVKGAYYSLLFDESTNACSKKELQISIRYWSNTQNKVVWQHIQSFFLGIATAEIVSEKIFKAIDNICLQRCYLLMLGSDGPNVNKKVHRLVNEEQKAVCERNLVDIGTCNIHIIHNAFLKGLSELGEDAVELITALYYYFDGWPARWETFTEVQNKEGVPNNKFIKHCTSRWLTVEPAARRVLEQWTAITSYFLKEIPTKKPDKGMRYKSIVTLLKKNTIKAEIQFVISSANLFTRFTRFFQKEEPLVHILHSELVSLLQTLLGRFCKQTNLGNSLENLENFLREENWLPFNKMQCSETVTDELKNVSENDRKYFMKDVRNHYLTACKEILEKTSVSSSLLKKLTFLHPSERKTVRSCRNIVAVAKSLQLNVSDDILLDEWKILQLEKEIGSPEDRIDIYWSKFLLLKNDAGEIKYANVAKVIKAALVLSHGNADVERGFSASSRVLTEDRASMCERTLDAIMTVKSMLKLYDNRPELVPITKKLLDFARSAHKNYQLYLNEQKYLKEQEEIKKKKDEEEKMQQKAKQEKLAKEREIIEKYEKSLKEKREKEESIRKSGDKLLLEATERLKKGVSDKNMSEIYLANAMLEGVATIRNDEQEERKNVNKIQKALEKRKSSVINSFFCKKPKKE